MSSIKKSLCSANQRRGIISIIVFTVVWEICTRLHVPIIGNVPAPSSVIGSMGKQLTGRLLLISWRDSMMRIVGGCPRAGHRHPAGPARGQQDGAQPHLSCVRKSCARSAAGVGSGRGHLLAHP